MMIKLEEITKCFVNDATFKNKYNLNKHYKKHKQEYNNPTKEEYAKHAEKASLKRANGKNIKAFKEGNRTKKYNENTKDLVVYADGRENGEIVTLYKLQAGKEGFNKMMNKSIKENKGKEITE